ncbi:MAG: threonine-phosphate decarboxylase [Cyanothece sp. SIO2G6]|nr:threonine-phosphate decarboxylase [Cyanothece sp. SIO2G6]
MARPTHGGNRNWAAQLANCDPDQILDFSASINPLGPPQSVLQAIQTNLHRVTAYPDPSYGELQSALATFHDIPMDWIMVGNGAAELLTWVGRELAALPQTYVLAPGFADYHRAITAFNGKLSPLALDLDRLSRCSETVTDWVCCPELVTAIATKPDSSSCGLLINTPHNPTGVIFSRRLLQPLLEQFALVVVDEAFMDFLPPEQQQSVLDLVLDWPNLVVVRSLTKFYSLPGLRLGYVVAHPDYLQRWQQWRDPWPVNVLAEVAAIAALDDHDFQHQTWDWLTATRPPLSQALQAIPGLTPFPASANFFLVQTEGSSTQLQQQLLQHHQILIRDCLSFRELGDRYFRIAIRRPVENQQLLNGIQQVMSISV